MEIDRATWRRYQYRVRRHRDTKGPPIFGITCPQCTLTADGLACAPCFEANGSWATQHGLALGGRTTVSMGELAQQLA